ncbi:MAG: hypothetical protein FJX71_02340 [Alphaproteobacteria bacterium]|nr:hypothetical protein [Alphaproteobacteria bacterium]
MENLCFKSSNRKKNIVGLYAFITNQSRQPIFFKEYQVPDTVLGRFEILTLHLALMFRRLKFLKEEEQGVFSDLSQDLSNWVVADIDESIRAMRVSDLKITLYLKKFIEGFYGRLIAYDKALESNDKNMLEEAIHRNIFGIVDDIPMSIVNGLVSYTFQTWGWLVETKLSCIINDLKGDMPHANRSNN